MKRKRSAMGFDTEEFRRPAKRKRLNDDYPQPEVDPQELPAKSLVQTAISYRMEYLFSEETSFGSTDTQAIGQDDGHVISPAGETRLEAADSLTSNNPLTQSKDKQEKIIKSRVTLPAGETGITSTDSQNQLSDQTSFLEEDAGTLDYLLILINEYLYETTAVPSVSSVLQELAEPDHDADLAQIAAATEEDSRCSTDSLHMVPQTALSTPTMLGSVNGDSLLSSKAGLDLPSCSTFDSKSYPGTEQPTPTDSGQQTKPGSIRHKEGVPRRQTSIDSESKLEPSPERASRKRSLENDATRKSASRKRSHETDASQNSASKKRSYEKSASQKRSSTKSATLRKRHPSRSESPDESIERTQLKKAKRDIISCEGQRTKVKDSQRSRHAQFVKNQGTSQASQRQPLYTSLIAKWKQELSEWSAKNREIDSKDAHKMKYPSHLHEWLERVKFNHTRKWKMLHYEKPKWTPLQLALTSKSRRVNRA